MVSFRIPLRALGFGGIPVINRKIIELHFQRCPGNDHTNGIADLEYEVAVGTGPKRKGKTDAQGTVKIALAPTEVAQLSILGSTYEVSMLSGDVEAVNTAKGQQRRLRSMGYQIGHSGPDGNGVDGINGYQTERSVLDFQADQGILIDAIVGNTTQTHLTNESGA